MMREPSLMMWTWYLEKMAAQSLSQSCPMEINEPVLRPGRMCPVCAVGGSCGARLMVAVWVAGMMVPLAAVIDGPVEVGVTLEQR